MSRRKSTSLPDSSRRRHKHLADSDDRISDLPDSILGHILSHLPTKNAVATGVLSKRWNFLWTTVGNLDFRRTNYTGGTEEEFVQFVNYVMLLHKPAGYFNKLSLTWETECIPFHVNTWICAALARDVHELIVSVCISKLPIHVQSYLFSSESLRSLELKCRICISSEIVVSLPRLERLELNLVYFQSEEAFRKFVDGCPVLKYLIICLDIEEMIRCGYIEIVDGVAFKCIISSTSLKRLYVYPYTALCSVELDAPSLEYINLMINGIIIQQRLNFLGEADILLTPIDYETEDPKYWNSLVEALHALSCAKTLKLSEEVIKALSRATIKMQTRYNRLTRLEVKIDQNYWSSLQDLIELSDNLEVLVVNKDADYYDDAEYYDDADYYDDAGHFNNSNWTNPNVVPRCLSNSLRAVSIRAYDGHLDELAMVEYILRHGSVLKIMKICFCFPLTFNKDFKRMYELVKQICAVTRKSPTCEVKFADLESDLESDDDALL